MSPEIFLVPVLKEERKDFSSYLPIAYHHNLRKQTTYEIERDAENDDEEISNGEVNYEEVGGGPHPWEPENDGNHKRIADAADDKDNGISTTKYHCNGRGDIPAIESLGRDPRVIPRHLPVTEVVRGRRAIHQMCLEHRPIRHSPSLITQGNGTSAQPPTLVHTRCVQEKVSHSLGEIGAVPALGHCL
ncbi:unnamed protein product [Allacma fusca]|uniref:Uncharacterized protein n=1 Tax=Allacma fusca TaxID=39272 RepID=A0A8J2JUG9_9HEXA|nr:unnamed protein product [Allacma fusca]